MAEQPSAPQPVSNIVVKDTYTESEIYREGQKLIDEGDGFIRACFQSNYNGFSAEQIEMYQNAAPLLNTSVREIDAEAKSDAEISRTYLVDILRNEVMPHYTAYMSIRNRRDGRTCNECYAFSLFSL